MQERGGRKAFGTRRDRVRGRSDDEGARTDRGRQHGPSLSQALGIPSGNLPPLYPVFLLSGGGMDPRFPRGSITASDLERTHVRSCPVSTMFHASFDSRGSSILLHGEILPSGIRRLVGFSLSCAFRMRARMVDSSLSFDSFYVPGTRMDGGPVLVFRRERELSGHVLWTTHKPWIWNGSERAVRKACAFRPIESRSMANCSRRGPVSRSATREGSYRSTREALWTCCPQVGFDPKRGTGNS